MKRIKKDQDGDDYDDDVQEENRKRLKQDASIMEIVFVCNLFFYFFIFLFFYFFIFLFFYFFIFLFFYFFLFFFHTENTYWRAFHLF